MVTPLLPRRPTVELSMTSDRGRVMSAATIDTNESTSSAARRNNGGLRGRSAAERRSQRELTQSIDATELAIVEFVNGSYDAMRAFAPQAVLRPTQAVDYVFDLAEQALSASRRFCLEIASIVEAGVQGSERSAAA